MPDGTNLVLTASSLPVQPPYEYLSLANEIPDLCYAAFWRDGDSIYVSVMPLGWVNEKADSASLTGEWTRDVAYGEDGLARLVGETVFEPHSDSTGNVVTVETTLQLIASEGCTPDDSTQAAVRLCTNGCLQVWTRLRQGAGEQVGWVDVEAVDYTDAPLVVQPWAQGVQRQVHFCYNISMKIIDGKQLAQNLRAEIAAGVGKLKSERGVTPGLAVILVGDNPASVSYVTAKEKACTEAGMYSREIRLPETTTEAELVKLVKDLNADPAIHGILVQLPVPKHISDKAVIDAIAPEKDVDGFTPVNVGRMLIGERCFLPCTPHGIIKLIEFSGMDIRGKHAVVIGRSNIVGKPVAALLSRKETNATVTLCHTGTPDVGKFTREADIVVVAAGRPNTVTGDMLKPGAVVIDVGVNRIPDATKPKGFRLVGDADFDSCSKVAGAITPVPGGVGPMTITMLLWNTLESARR